MVGIFSGWAYFLKDFLEFWSLSEFWCFASISFSLKFDDFSERIRSVGCEGLGFGWNREDEEKDLGRELMEV